VATSPVRGAQRQAIKKGPRRGASVGPKVRSVSQIFLPGRARLSTKPLPTASGTKRKTTGAVNVAFFAYDINQSAEPGEVIGVP
jgi:hypothetical protein